MKSYQLAILLTVLLAVSCRTNMPPVLSISIDRLHKDGISANELFSNVDLICLDSTALLSNSVFTKSTLMTKSEDKYFILDEKSLDIYVFGVDGKLLQKSTKRGRGHGEYSMATQIYYDRDENLVDVLNPMGQIYRYTPDNLDFHSVIDYVGKGPRSTHEFLRSGGAYYLYSFSDPRQFWRYDPAVGEMFEYKYGLPDYLRKYVSPQAMFLTMDDKPCFFRAHDGCIFSFEDKTSKRIVEWDLGRYGCSADDIPKGLTNREYYNYILDNSSKKISPFIDIKTLGPAIISNVIHKGEIYSMFYYPDEARGYFFFQTREDMKFSLGLCEGTVMYKFLDYASIPEYVNRDVLDDESRLEYDKAMRTESSVVAIYTVI